MRFFLPLLLFLLPVDEGMWTFNNFPAGRVQKKYGFRPTQEWLDHLRLSSVRFNNGGSGSFVSANGLVMTNHHVGSECIQELSSQGRDYMSQGFYAARMENEGKCPNLELNELMSIADVTSEVNAGIAAEAAAAARGAAQRGNMARIEKKCAEETKLRCDVITLYEGGQFHLYRYKKYTDVRLVFAPEADIAFFGGDPDNFTYPRYDLDIALFRVYENSKPVKIEHYLRWSPQGAQEGEVAFVSGNPGSTGRQLTTSQLEFLRDHLYPYRIEIFRRRIEGLKQFSSRGEEQARRARDNIFSYENSFKALSGYQSGLLDPKLMAKRAEGEKALRAKAAAKPEMQKEFGGAWDAIAQAQKNYEKFYKQYLALIGMNESSLFPLARHLVRMPVEKNKPNEQRLREYRDSNLPAVEQDLYSPAPIYTDLETFVLGQSLEELEGALGREHELIQRILAGQTPQQAAARYVTGSRLADVAVRRKLAEGGVTAVESSMDTMIQLARAMDAQSRAIRKRYEDEIEAVERRNGSLLAKALFATQGASIYPEATFTLRLSYGAVKGYLENGKKIPYTTTFQGLYERATGKDPYKLPQRWLDKKSQLRLATPFNFVLTADIIGGNSGSPVVNRRGEVIGLIFDGNIQSLPNRFLYTEDIARAVAVHSAGILEALKSVYGAEAVLKELRPKE